MRRAPLTLFALLLIGLGVWLMAGGMLPAFLQAAPTVTPAGFATSRPPTTTFPSPSATAASAAGPIPDGYRVQLPRLRIDLPIKEGDLTRDIDNQQTPEHAAFHLPGTRIPGEGSNTYIYAHARTGMFLSLWEAREGDEVIIVTPGGAQLRYVVSEVYPRIPPTETKWVQPTSAERLTLQTSTGPNPQDPRFVVVALPR